MNNLQLIKSDAQIDDVITAMKSIITEHAAKDKFKKLAARLRDGDFHKNVFDFAFGAADYEPNPHNHQIVKTPEYVLREGRASCVDYSILIGTLLSAGGENFSLKLISQEPDKYGHIYVVANDGVVLDCVIGQDEFRNTRKAGYYNKEAPYLSARIYPISAHKTMELSVINGDLQFVDAFNGTSTINGTANINGTSSINDYPYSIEEINGCTCQNIDGDYVPVELNGVIVSPKLPDMTEDEYKAYLLAVNLGDKDAISPVNGLKGFLAKHRAKKEERAAKRDQKKTDRANKKEGRRAARRRFGEKFNKILDSGMNFLDSKTQANRAQAQDTLQALDDMGIEPDAQGAAKILKSTAGGDGDSSSRSTNLLPLLIGAGLLYVATK